MLIKKAFKFRLYPNKEQEVLINKTFGCARFVANYVMAKQQKVESYWYITEELVQQGFLKENNYKSTFFIEPLTTKVASVLGCFIDKYQAIKDVAQLKKHYEWLKEVDSIALQSSVEDVADAYSRYYKKQSSKSNFKGKNNPVQSYTTKSINKNIALGTKHIKLPKLGLVRFANSQLIGGVIKRATISKTASGKYFDSALAEVEVNELPKTSSTVGIDVGLTKFATLSDGVHYSNPSFFKQLETKLAIAQRKLSRRKYGSNNWEKQRLKVARIHERIVNCRKDYLQKISTEIVKNHDIIGMEDLKVSSMLKAKHYAKAISEVSWAEFRTMIAYKCEWYGKKLVLVDAKYTSQKCNICGHTTKSNRLTQSKFECVSCNHTDNADINASKNIKDLALAG